MSKLSITLLFSDDRSVRLEGDRELVLDMIRSTEGTFDGFIKHDYYMMDTPDQKPEWDLNALTKLISQEGEE